MIIKYDKKLKLYLPQNPRPTNKGYSDAGASHKKKSLKGFTATSGSPSEDIDENNQTLRQRARMLYMAAPIATSAIRTNRTNVVGVGLQLKSRIERDIIGMTAEQAELWQKKTEREFALWANKKNACDATGINNFDGMQQLALTSWLISGDCIGVFSLKESTPLLPYRLRLHLIEADRISTPNDNSSLSPLLTTIGINKENNNKIYDGIEIDESGMIVAYHVCSHYPNSSNILEEKKWIRIEAYGKETGLPNVIHVMDSERADQYRGVSYLAQVIEPLLQLRRYTESELTAAVIQSFLTAFIKTEANTDEMPFNEAESDIPQISNYDNEYEMGPGQINILKPGEEVQLAESKHPNSGFETFVRAVTEQVGAALEIPHDLLLKSFSKSYSASRAALLEAWKGFRMRREWFTDDFCKPIYEVWLSEAVASGRITAPGFFTNPLIRDAYLGSQWIGPSQGQLDPEKEINAETLAVKEGFTTREQATVRLNGGDWESNIDQLQRENEKVAESKKLLEGEIE